MDRVFTLLSKIILVLIIIFLLIGIIDYAVIAIEYFKGERMELGSLADWFSGLCNAVMAGAAVYAAYSAPSWIVGKRRERADTYCFQFIEDTKKLFKLIRFIHENSIANNIKIDDGLVLNSDDNGEIVEKLSELQEVISNLYELKGMFRILGVELLNINEFEKLIDASLTYSNCISSLKYYANDSDYPNAKKWYDKSKKSSDEINSVKDIFDKPIDELFKFK
ncbi:hypothetical protein [Edwardsiella tarda]|uniref:hypothetical protein n=1 Tax=Edwardsiella tarda TaxID=636 RepID=UPI00351BFD08